ncbi:hypothetical protein [Corynebacterium poyangense]|nr:hypothetical protein [Corynebacterium poyangense]
MTFLGALGIVLMIAVTVIISVIIGGLITVRLITELFDYGRKT